MAYKGGSIILTLLVIDLRFLLASGSSNTIFMLWFRVMFVLTRLIPSLESTRALRMSKKWAAMVDATSNLSFSKLLRMSQLPVRQHPIRILWSTLMLDSALQLKLITFWATTSARYLMVWLLPVPESPWTLTSDLVRNAALMSMNTLSVGAVMTQLEGKSIN